LARQIGQAIDELMAWPLRVALARGCSPPREVTFADDVKGALPSTSGVAVLSDDGRLISAPEPSVGFVQPCRHSLISSSR